MKRHTGRTVIFDLGGVFFSDGTLKTIRIIANQYNLPRELVENVIKGNLGNQYRIGTLTTEEFWNKAKTYWNIEASSENLSDIWLNSYRPIHGTVRIIDGLKKEGHELMYLSNNTKKRVEYLDKRYSFLDKFDDGVFSYLIKRQKPDPIMYQTILAKTSNLSENCVYVDDKEEFLKPAENLGMDVITFKNPWQLEEALKMLSMLIN